MSLSASLRSVLSLLGFSLILPFASVAAPTIGTEDFGTYLVILAADSATPVSNVSGSGLTVSFSGDADHIDMILYDPAHSFTTSVGNAGYGEDTSGDCSFLMGNFTGADAPGAAYVINYVSFKSDNGTDTFNLDGFAIYYRGEQSLSFTVGAYDASGTQIGSNVTLNGFTETADAGYTAGYRTVSDADLGVSFDNIVEFRVAPSDSSKIAVLGMDDVVIGGAPTVDLNGATAGTDTTATFTAGGSAVQIAPSATITDNDDTNLASITLTLANRPDGDGNEGLSLTSAGITAATNAGINSFVYTSSTGVLTMSGSATVAAYQAALQNVTYYNLASSATTTDRTITVVANDGAANSTSRTAVVSISIPTAATSSAAGFNTTNGTNLTPSFTFGSADETLTVAAAAHLVGSTANGSTGTDTLVVPDGGDLTTLSSLSGFETLTLAANANVTLSETQHDGFTTINGNTGSETLTLATPNGDGSVSADPDVETYVLGTSGFTLTLGAAAQNVTGSTGIDTVHVGGLTLTGTLNGNTGTDTLSLASGASLSGATISGFENLTLASGSITLTPAQLNAFTGTLTAPGSNTLIFDAAGTLTGTNLAPIETYVIGVGGSKTITLPASTADGKTLTVISTIDDDHFVVTGSDGDQTITGSNAADTLDGGAGNDTLNGGSGADTLTGGTGTDAFVGSTAQLNGDTITDLSGGETLRLTGVTGLSTANVRFNGTSFEIDTNATTFASPEVTISTVSNLSSTLSVYSVADDNSDTLITFSPAPPTVTGVSSSTANGYYKAGDTISIQVTFNGAVTVTGTPTLTLETGTTDRTASYVSGTGSTTLTFTYTVQVGDLSADLDTASTSALALAGGTIQDSFPQNAVLTLPTPGTTGSLGANKALVIDTVPPTVSTAEIALSGASGTGGTFKVGDTVKATWDNSAASGDGNIDLNTVTFDFSALGGGSAVSGSAVSDVWSATYTLTAGSIDTPSAKINVTGTDYAGNHTTRASSNVSIDNLAPTVTDAALSLSGGSGTSGTFIIGDTVTATWNDTASGDNNADTVASVTFDFSAFGGGSTVTASNASDTWTASYVLTGSTEATNLNVSATVTDNAGNVTATADTTNAAIDLSAPAITSTSTLAATYNTAASYTITASGSPASFGASGLPAGLSVNSGTGAISGSPTAVGTFNATLSATDAAGNTGSAPLTITVNKATASISFSGLTPTYTGSPLTPTVTTTPSGLTVNLTYDSSTTAPTNAGSYTVEATIDDTHYQGGDNDTFTIAKADQTISFGAVGSLSIGSPVTLSATASSGLTPVNLALTAGSGTLDGNTLTATGTDPITITATQAGDNNTNAVTDSLTISSINQLGQTISFGPLADRSATDSSFDLSATASSGLPVAFTIVSGPAMLSGNSVTLTGASGTVVVRADQPGDAAYAAAPSVSQSFAVTQAGPLIFFGTTSDGTEFAVEIPAGKDTGTLFGKIAATGQFYILTFQVNTDRSISALSLQVLGDPQTAATSLVASPLRKRTTDHSIAADASYSFTGSIVGGVLTFQIAELGVTLNGTVEPANGPTAHLAGLYESSSLNSANGTTSSIVGTTGKVYVLAVTPNVIAGGSGTVATDGNFSLSTTQQITVVGNVDAPSTTVTGTIVMPDGTEDDFAGLGTGTLRTDRLINLSTRAHVDAEAGGSLVTGFVIGGTTSKEVLLRAVGPTLATFGLSTALPDPTVTIYNAAGEVVTEVDNWDGSPATAATMARIGAFALPAGSKDAVVATTLAPGAYTMRVNNVTGTAPGVAIAEIYDAAENPNSEYQRLINISSRGYVVGGEGQLVGGFIVTGNNPKRVLIRGIGAGLARYGVPRVLADPQLKLYNRNETVIATNDNWETPQTVFDGQRTANAAEIATANATVGAFALADGAKDAALIITLQPGAYTVSLGSASDGGTGNALIEIYEIPE